MVNDACMTESRREERILQLLRLLNLYLEKRKVRDLQKLQRVTEPSEPFFFSESRDLAFRAAKKKWLARRNSAWCAIRHASTLEEKKTNCLTFLFCLGIMQKASVIHCATSCCCVTSDETHRGMSRNIVTQDQSHDIKLL